MSIGEETLHEQTNFEVIGGHVVYNEVCLEGVTLTVDTSYVPKNSASDGVCNYSFRILVTTSDGKKTETFQIQRSLLDFIKLNRHIHQCQRHYVINPNEKLTQNLLPNLEEIIDNNTNPEYEEVRKEIENYIQLFERIKVVVPRFVKCSKVIKWFCLDCAGRYCTPSKPEVNRPGLAVGECVSEWTGRCKGELSLRTGDLVSITRVAAPRESCWWFGKNLGGGPDDKWRSSTIGYFPYDCVRVVKQDSSLNIPADLQFQKSVPVGVRYGKKVPILKTLLSSRPPREVVTRSRLGRKRFTLDHYLEEGARLPGVVDTCLKFVMSHVITEGVYRLSGKTRVVNRLHDLCQSNLFPSLAQLEKQEEVMMDPHSVPSFIKQFFRSLAAPLISPGIFQNCSITCVPKIPPPQRIRNYKVILGDLDLAHSWTLKALLQHLHHLLRHRSETSMNEVNLATVWAPSVFNVTTDESIDTSDYNMAATLDKLAQENALFQDFLSHAPEIFEFETMEEAAETLVESLKDHRLGDINRLSVIL